MHSLSINLAAARWTLTADPPPATPDRPGPAASLRAALEGGVPATVPGSVHTDLLAAGFIEDPYGFRAEDRLAWIGHTDWTYTASLRSRCDDALAHDRLDLACDGLDTFAVLTLNDARRLAPPATCTGATGSICATAAQAGTNVQTDDSLCRPGARGLCVAEAVHGGPLPHQGHGSNPPMPHNMVRKMACSYGWDWGPMLPSAGVWRGIRIEAWNVARLADVRPAVTEATAARATVDLAIDLERAAVAAPPTVRVVLAGPDGKTVFGPADCPVEATTARATLTVPDPQRWWPVGHGAQPRYTLTTALLDADGSLLQTDTRRIGLRTAALDLTPDATAGEVPRGQTAAGTSLAPDRSARNEKRRPRWVWGAAPGRGGGVARFSPASR